VLYANLGCCLSCFYQHLGLRRLWTYSASERPLEYVNGGRTAWEDVIFALFMTTEFATNH